MRSLLLGRVIRSRCGFRLDRRTGFQVVAQCRREILHRGIAVGQFRDGFQADGFQAGINAGKVLRRRIGVDVQNLADDFRDRPFEGPPPAEEFVEHHAQAVDVGGRSHRLAVAAGLFRRHVGGRPHDLAAVADLGVAGIRPAGQAENQTRTRHHRWQRCLSARHSPHAGPQSHHRTNKYLNNRLEQDHRAVKQRYYPMRGFGSFAGAARFCTVFDELRQYFRSRSISQKSLPLPEQRRHFRQRFNELVASFQAA